jgi:glutamate synthase (NADPH/NADH) small chain
MESEGVDFEMGVRVGEDISYRYLQGRFDAICLCAGARNPRDLSVAGRELGGIHFAMDFLVQQNKLLNGEPLEAATSIHAGGKHVVVIGGGDTGADCLGTSLRQGAKSVVQLEILPQPPPTRSLATPWPMWPTMLRLSSSHKEGGERHWSVGTKAFLGEDGKVKELRIVDVEWVSPSNGGRPVMKEKSGSERVISADLVLLAMGFMGPKPNRIVTDLGIRTESTGVIWRDANNMTNVPGVFVSGDMSLGATLVVRAISDGRKAAMGIARYLDAKGKR